jgi:hypothetical protein
MTTSTDATLFESGEERWEVRVLRGDGQTMTLFDVPLIGHFKVILKSEIHTAKRNNQKHKQKRRHISFASFVS